MTVSRYGTAYLRYDQTRIGSVRRDRHVPLPSASAKGMILQPTTLPSLMIIVMQLNLWTMGFIVSPFLSPFAFGFMVARAK